MNKVRSGLEKRLVYRWRFPIAYLMIAGVSIVGLFIGIVSQPAGAARVELEYLDRIDSFGALLDDPTNPFIRILQIVSLKYFGLSEIGLRLGTAITAGLGVIAFFLMLRLMYWRRLAIVGTLMLATSSWVWHHGRISSDSVMILLLMSAFIYFAYKLIYSKKIMWAAALGVVTALGLYTPLFIYFLIGMLAFNYRAFFIVLKHKKRRHQIVGISLFTMLLAPLFYFIATDVSILRTLLNVPADLPSPSGYLSNITESFAHIFWSSNPNPAWHLDILPMLDIFTVTMAALGLYKFEQGWPSRRSKFVFGSFIFLILGIALNPTDQAIFTLAPLVYLLAANGVSTLITQWYSIFPRNPIARVTAIMPLFILFVVVFSYHYNRYFIAWPNTAETHIEFDQKPIKVYDEAKNDLSPTLIISAPDSVEKFAYLRTRFEHVTVIDARDVTIQRFEGFQIIYRDMDAPLSNDILAELGRADARLHDDSQINPVLFKKHIR